MKRVTIRKTNYAIRVLGRIGMLDSNLDLLFWNVSLQMTIYVVIPWIAVFIGKLPEVCRIL